MASSDMLNPEYFDTEVSHTEATEAHDAETIQAFDKNNRPSEDQITDLAKYFGVATTDICRICGRKIIVQIFRNSGVCSEQHRKDRDNDHAPFRGGALAP